MVQHSLANGQNHTGEMVVSGRRTVRTKYSSVGKVWFSETSRGAFYVRCHVLGEAGGVYLDG